MDHLSVVPFIGLIGTAVMYGYPAYRTGLTLKQNTAGVEKTQWLVYWIILIVYSQLHMLVLDFIVPYIPLYLEIEAVFFLWLIHPGFLGALFLWEKLQPLHKTYDEKIFEFLAKKGVKSPPKAEVADAKKKVVDATSKVNIPPVDADESELADKVEGFVTLVNPE